MPVLRITRNRTIPDNLRLHTTLAIRGVTNDELSLLEAKLLADWLCGRIHVMDPRHQRFVCLSMQTMDVVIPKEHFIRFKSLIRAIGRDDIEVLDMETHQRYHYDAMMDDNPWF